MLKYLMLLALGVAVWWFWRQKMRAGADGQKPVTAPVEDMVCCAHCAVYLPRSEARRSATLWYCCLAHEQAGPASPTQQ